MDRISQPISVLVNKKLARCGHRSEKMGEVFDLVWELRCVSSDLLHDWIPNIRFLLLQVIHTAFMRVVCLVYCLPSRFLKNNC
jgi:hypothetical protein